LKTLQADFELKPQVDRIAEGGVRPFDNDHHLLAKAPQLDPFSKQGFLKSIASFHSQRLPPMSKLP
jgi:hypothetical protein